VRVPMTHDVLSELAGARRPSVSSALGRLRDAGLLDRDERGWLLRGDQPSGQAAAAAVPISDERD
jgi:CRP/FNR family cyclic AMP-dependent transcriptional regulator